MTFRSGDVSEGRRNHPPFAEGNRQAVSHGAWSEALYSPIARELAAGVLDERPGLARYREAVTAWADLEARAIVLRRWLEDKTMLNAKGVPRPATKLLLSVTAAADQARRRLGLDPRSDAELAKAVSEAQALTADLDSVREAGRAALAAREQAQVVEVGRDPSEGAQALSEALDGSEVEDA